MMNIQIMRVFTKVRELLMDTLNLRIEIEEIKKQITNHDKNIELVFSYLDEFYRKSLKVYLQSQKVYSLSQ